MIFPVEKRMKKVSWGLNINKTSSKPPGRTDVKSSIFTDLNVGSM